MQSNSRYEYPRDKTQIEDRVCSFGAIKRKKSSSSSFIQIKFTGDNVGAVCETSAVPRAALTIDRVERYHSGIAAPLLREYKNGQHRVNAGLVSGG